MSTLGHRLVPIRPSPNRGVSCQKGMTVIKSSPMSPSTPPQTGIKRKYDDEDDDSDTESCKRRINFAMNYVCSSQPVSISRRNARERNRVKQVNNGFAALRQHIPGAARAKKISKVDTLKQAVEYIQNLQLLLDENDRALDDSQQLYPQERQAESDASQSFSDIDEQYINHNKIGFLKPPFYYNENVSPDSPSEPDTMSPEIHTNSLSNGSHNLTCPPLHTPPMDNFTTMYLGFKSPDSILTSIANISTSSPMLHTSHNTICSNNILSSPIEKVKACEMNFTQHDSIHSSAIIPKDQFSTQPIPDENLPNSKPNRLIQTPYHHHILSPILSPLPCHLQIPSESVTNALDVPVISSQEYVNPVSNTPHLSIASKQPDNSPLGTKNFQTLTPIELSCIPDDLINSKLPQIEASYPTSFEAPVEKNCDSPFKSPPESCYDTSSTDSSYVALPNITNIDTVLSSNLMSSFTNIIDVYESIGKTSPAVEDDLLEAIDLWEKC